VPEGAVRALYEAIERVPEIGATLEPFPRTLCHGDCHIGNLLRDGEGNLVWADWQEVGISRGPEDLSFPLQRAFPTGETCFAEAAITQYRARLEAETGEPVSLDDVRRAMDGYELRARLLEWPTYLDGDAAADRTALRAVLGPCGHQVHGWPLTPHVRRASDFARVEQLCRTDGRWSMKRGLRVLALIVGGSLLLCAVGAGLSALRNRSLPSGSQGTGQLDPLDKARLAETLHLKRELGEQVWPGWGKTDIPVLIWNRDHSFLVGYPDPPLPWEPVPGDLFQEQTYLRQPTGEPQNFAVRVGDRWVASLATKWEMDAFIIDMIRDVLPSPLQPIVPYHLLIQPSEVQMTGVLHETFHVYQAQVAAERLDEAEEAHQRGEQYWHADAAMHKEWKQEIDLLVGALNARSDDKATTFAREFLEQRARRRAAAGLSAELIDYERQLEWEEGLAKYVELAIWREAHSAEGYDPLPDMASDPDFKAYGSFRRRWSQEIGQMKRQAAREGETRFYYTGMAQATLLDRLLPGWKDRALAENVWLETLLAEAVE
jgi:hypothetical protein